MEAVKEDFEAAWSAAEKAATEAVGNKETKLDAKPKAPEAGPGETGGEAGSDSVQADPTDGQGKKQEAPFIAHDRTERHDSDDSPDKGRDAAKRDVKPDKEESEKEAPEAPDAPPPKDKERIKKFIAEAKELGYEVPEGNIREVTLGERKAFRHKMHTEKAKLRTEFEARTAAIQEKEAQFKERFDKSEGLLRAMDSGNLEEIAKSLGYKDWRAVNEKYFKELSSPEAREIAQLRKEREAEKAERAKLEEQRRAHERNAHKERLMSEHKADIVDALKEYKGGAYASLASDPNFVQTVITHQQQHWDGADTIGIEEAIELANKDARSLLAHLQKLYGQPGSHNAEERAPAAGNGGRKPPRTVSHDKAADAARHAKPDMSDQDWSMYWANRL
jgi:fused signal recognition particle receptor